MELESNVRMIALMVALGLGLIVQSVPQVQAANALSKTDQGDGFAGHGCASRSHISADTGYLPKMEITKRPQLIS